METMEREKEKLDLLIEQYKTYIESKDRFIERNFQTNRFFLLFITLMFLLLALVKESLLFNITAVQVFSGIGVGVSFLWWANAEMYEYIMKAKYNNVINKLEEHLPFQLYAMEKAGLEEVKNQKPRFHLCRISYSEVQRLIALGSLLVFLIITISEIDFIW